MIAYSSRSREFAPDEAEFPCLVLKGDSWNDYGYQTLFHLFFYKSRGSRETIGDVKILQHEASVTKLPSKFPSLSADFCSLGQSLEYYQRLRKLGRKTENEILGLLRDIVKHPHFADAFQSEKGFQDSLLRFSEAEKVFREGRYVLGETVDKTIAPIDFTYSVKHKDASAPHQVHVRFADREFLPNRLMLFIGKNGTGKTWVLSKLAADVSGDERGKERFTPGRPRFSRVVAVSYSAFDLFRRPPTGQRTFSYQYCGIYDDAGNLVKRQRLLGRIAEAHQAVRERRRHLLWMQVLEDIFSKSFVTKCDEFLSDQTQDKGRWLSSGQTILLTVLTELLAVLEPESLILYDEPELHLHPNAMAGLMKGLQRVLSAFNCYAIVATHSPLILQQVPSHYVRVFTRIQNQTMIGPLPVESFGENLTLLTEEVFQVNAIETIFREWADSIVTKKSEEEITSAFGNKLSFNARTLLRTLSATNTRRNR